MSTCPEIARLKSPAKLNLGLSIVGRDTRGLHLLESLFWPISLCDDLTIQESSGHEVSITWVGRSQKPKLPSQAENLVYRLLTRLFPHGPFWKVNIEKRIPIGGGLGGGSSNAGTLLRYFREAFPDRTNEISSLAVSLGADVPFFLQSKPSWVTGIGENVEVVEGLNRGLFFLLIIPPFECPTKDVFQEFARNPHYSKARPRVTSISLDSYLDSARNDLEPAARSLQPKIAEVLAGMRRGRLSGSGATCFSVHASQQESEAQHKVLQRFCRTGNYESLAVGTHGTSS